MIRNHLFLRLLLFLFILHSGWAKPAVWIYTDMSDESLPGKNHMGTINDPDDISAMAGYLLMSNLFDTRGIVVASTHRDVHAETPHQGEWAQLTFGKAYQKDLPGLNQYIGGYPDRHEFIQSSIKETAWLYDPERIYASLEGWETVEALLQEAETFKNPIFVLCWGSLTEPAVLVNHCMATGKQSVLKGLRFIAHWTNSYHHQGTMNHPENVANCREDAAACAYLKRMALNGHITYFECGAIGQHGIVSGSPKGEAYFDAFRSSALGTLFVEGKFVHNSVDHSDSATYWVLLGNWGVGLDDLTDNGTSFPEVELKNEATFEAWSGRIHDELLRRSRAAASGFPE